MKQQKWCAFFVSLFLMPVSQASTTAAQYPHNPASTPTIDCISADSLKCYDAINQQLLWENRAIAADRGLLLDDKQLVINSDHAAIILDPRSGREIIRFANTGTLFDPVLSSGRLILSDQQGWIRVIDLKNKADLWRRRIEQSWVYPPAVIDNLLVTGGRDGYLSALDVSSGDLVWRRKIGQELVYRPVIAARKIFVSSFDAWLTALDPATGTILSRTRLSSPVFDIKPSGHLLIAAGYDGNLYAIDARSNRLRWHQRVADSLRYQYSTNEQSTASIDHRGNFILLDTASGTTLQHIQFEGRYQAAPLITHSKIRLFPSGKPFFNVPIQKTGHTDSRSPGGEI